MIAECLAAFPRPSRFVRRENRGAPATLNEAAALAGGSYLAFLNSDDAYAPGRISALVDAIARRSHAWGFSLVTNAFAGAVACSDPAFDILQKQRNFLGAQPASFTLVEFNVDCRSDDL